MKKKLLVVNLQNPQDSRYYPCSDAASRFLGRRRSNYLFFVVGQDGSADRIVLPETLDFAALEKILKDSVGRS